MPIDAGGGGGGGDDDDDDFFQGGDDEGDGDGSGDQHQNAFFRQVIPESYDKLSIGAVFAEWMRTIQDLPHILRQAVQMGLFSSAQLVRFFAMDVRPSITRTVSRCLPPTVRAGFGVLGFPCSCPACFWSLLHTRFHALACACCTFPVRCAMC